MVKGDWLGLGCAKGRERSGSQREKRRTILFLCDKDKDSFPPRMLVCTGPLRSSFTEEEQRHRERVPLIPRTSATHPLPLRQSR